MNRKSFLFSNVMCTPRTMKFTVCVGSVVQGPPRRSLFNCGWQLRWFGVAKDALQCLALVAEKNQASFFGNLDMELFRSKCRMGKGQWKKPLGVEY